MSHLLAKLRLRTSVLLVMIAANLVTTGVFTWHLYNSTSATVRASVDQRLVSAAQGLRLFADDHHHRLRIDRQFDDADYLQVLRRQAAFARGAQVTYAYTMIERGGKILFTSDSPTPADFADQSYAKLWEHYSDASAGLKATFADGKLRFDEYTDKWGTFRSVFIAVRGGPGGDYVIGADVDIAFIDAILRETLLEALLTGTVLLVLGCVATIALCAMIFQPLDSLVRRVDTIASGDLRQNTRVVGDNEIARLGMRINTMSASLRAMLEHIQRSAETLQSTAQTLSEQTAYSAQSTLRQVAQIEAATRTAAFVREDNEHILDDILRTRAASEEALRTAAAGRAVVATAVANVERAEVQSQAVGASIVSLNSRILDIEAVLTAIRGIAGHTDLLALNAAIEAARAGEQGRGFAVVAGEVRTLSAKTLTATRQIESTLRGVLVESERTNQAVQTSTSDARDASDCMSQVDAALDSIAHRWSIAHEEIEKITSHAQKQAKATREITDLLHRSKAISRDAANGVGQLATKASDLVRVASQLEATAARFRTE